VSQWSKPVYASGGNLDGPLQHHQVSQEAVDYLDAIAKVLGTTEKQDALPDPVELTGLLEQLSEVANSIEGSRELGDDVRTALLRRISQMRFAIENVRVGGPEGVEEAIELLLGAAVLRSARVPKATARKIFAVVAAAYTVFSAGPTIDASLQAWPHVIETLTAAPDATPDEAATTPPPISSKAR
jgi:hypothetical protein